MAFAIGASESFRECTCPVTNQAKQALRGSFRTMKIEDKKALLADVWAAVHALGRIDDGPHDYRRVPRFSTCVRIFEKDCLGTMAGLALLAALLESEIGTDNL